MIAEKDHAASNGYAVADPLVELEQVVRRDAGKPLESASVHRGLLGDARGVIHIGAHVGQELELYHDLPVIWVEAIPMVFRVLCEKIADYPEHQAFNYLIADGKRHRFGIANNAAASSSIFDLKLHKELWPDVGYVAKTEMESITLAKMIERHDIDLDVYDTLVLDVQGAELMVLQGAGEHMKKFRRVITEAADFEAYAGGCQLSDLDLYLDSHGFARMKRSVGMEKDGVGTYYEVVYDNIKKNPAWSTAATFEPLKGVRLNLGSSDKTVPGFDSIDRRLGTEVYPLPNPDDSVEEILASHVLEHFSHRVVADVLKHWVAKLKPGGKIRLAVPDFEKLATLYLDGAPVNVMGYTMGGHSDENDHHGCLFDRELLTEMMITSGLERIGHWVSDVPGCSQDEFSLNLQGFKPSGPDTKLTNVRAVMSVPRFGPLMHPRCAERAFHELHLQGESGQSCFWHQRLSIMMEDAITDPSVDFVLTMDFDTIFCSADILELYRLLKAAPDVDAVFPVQSKRGTMDALFSVPGMTPGKCRAAISTADLERNLLPAYTGHFGLTMFRADTLRKHKRPWMVPEPNAEGKWNDGQRDADIDFWKRWQEAGFKACLAPRVVVGHLEEVVKWPGKDLTPIYQTTGDYVDVGIPAEVVR